MTAVVGCLAACLLLHTAPAGATERPGAAPAAEAASPQAPIAAFVSDSMGHTAQEEITAEVTRDRELSYFAAIPATDISDHRQALVRLTRGPGGPDILVIMLGTAQTGHPAAVPGFESDVRGILDALTPHVDCIRWFDLQGEHAPFYAGFDENRLRFNAIIRRVVADYPDTEYYHYSTWVDVAPRSYRWWDGLHLTPAGDRQLGRLVRTATNGCDPALTSGPFWDVPDRFWAADDIRWLHEAGLATGYDNRTYRAQVGSFPLSVTRAQLAAMLWRHAGRPAVSAPHRFRDSPNWLDPALRWLRSVGLVDGWPDGTFRPGRPATRAWTIRLLWRAAGSPTGAPRSPFVDVPPWIDAAVDWGAATGIATGYGDSTFRPDLALTRGQIARMVHRYHDVTTTAAPDPPPPSTTAPSPGG